MRVTPLRERGRRNTISFTLLELLVVLGILALLGSLITLGLARARDKAYSMLCANNLRQLQVCWYLYSSDNRDLLVPNNFIYDGVENSPYVSNATWCPGMAAEDLTHDNIRLSLLYPYSKSEAIYRCPSDKSWVMGTQSPRTRSYSMSQSVNGFPEFDPTIQARLPSYKTIEQIVRPPTSRLFVFLDVHEDGISDSVFGTPTEAWGDLGTWWDVPGDRHLQGCNLSFADGHVEHWKWQVRKNVDDLFPQMVAPGETGDHERILSGTLQSF